MIQNRRKIILSGFFVMIGLILTCFIGYHFYYVAQGRYEVYRGAVKEVLEEAILLEINKRDTLNIPYYGNISSNRPKDQSKSQRKLSMLAEKGKLELVVSESKFKNNVIDNAMISGLHSFLLSHNPMNVDTLYRQVQNLLPTSMINRGHLWIRLNHIGINKVQTTTYAPDSMSVQQADSLCSRYIGYQSEWEVSAFTTLAWPRLLTIKEWSLCVAVLLLWMIVCACRKLLYGLVDRLFIREEVVKKEVEKTVIKAIPVKTVEVDIDTSVYQLREGIYFDAEKRELFTVSDRIKLVPRSAEILQLLLENPQHICSKQELKNRFWPDEVPANLSNRLSNAIYKLNKELKTLIPLSIVSEGDHYKLFWEGEETGEL